MIDIKLIRENPDLVRDNIKKKFQDHKLSLVDEIIDLDTRYRELRKKGDELRSFRNTKSKEIGGLLKDGKKDEAEAVKNEVAKIGDEINNCGEEEKQLEELIRSKMMLIPNIIDPSVPIGEDDTHNIEIERFGEPFVPEYEVPHHADILDKVDGLDKESAGRTSGEGFYYLKGDIARLHEAMLAYARDFMIDKGFTYFVPPFMIRHDVVDGVMSFEEMDSMMYKIEGEDLYLIGTSEHSMIGRFK